MTIIVLGVEEFAPSPALEAAWLAELPAARRMQLQEWPDASARRRSLLGSRLLREGLQRLGYAADSLSGLSYAQHGKPTVDLPVDLSLAHSAGRTVCALSTTGRIGVDVERIGDMTAAPFEIYLTAAERAWAGDDPRRFYALWTRKEAVVKAAGTLGLVQLRDVSIEHDRATFAGTCWRTAPVPVHRDFSAHVAFVESQSAPTFDRISKEELCNDAVCIPTTRVKYLNSAINNR